jgi:hypothetical protein
MTSILCCQTLMTSGQENANSSCGLRVHYSEPKYSNIHYSFDSLPQHKSKIHCHYRAESRAEKYQVTNNRQGVLNSVILN